MFTYAAILAGSSGLFLGSKYNIDLCTKLHNAQFSTYLYIHVFCHGILLCLPLSDLTPLYEFGQWDFYKYDISWALKSPFALGSALTLLSAFFMKILCLS